MRVAVVIGMAFFASVAPAHAVVGGEKIEMTDVPWFALVGGCGGTLVAPDRVLTAAHCVAGQTPEDVGGAIAGGNQSRKVTRFAMHPRWRHRNGESFQDDVAIVELDAPITGVVPVTLGGTTTENARIIGAGRPFAPGTGHSEAEMYDGALRQATLRQLTDRQCAKDFKGYDPVDHERFNAARMRCAIDPDGKEPLASGCNGDSGGPLVAGTNDAPVLLGVVSWGGDRCGADHLPSVFADVNRYRAFITEPNPVWAPTHKTAVKIRGKHTLTCRAASREHGTRLEYVWKRLPRSGLPIDTGKTGRTYKPSTHGRVGCFVYASNDGGEILAGIASVVA